MEFESWTGCRATKGSAHPVHAVGNAASGQFQLDGIYGELILLPPTRAAKKMGLAARIRRSLMPAKKLIEWVEQGGGARTTASGRCAAWAAALSRTRRSWRLGCDRSRAAQFIEEFGVGGEERLSMLPHLRALRRSTRRSDIEAWL